MNNVKDINNYEFVDTELDGVQVCKAGFVLRDGKLQSL